MSAGRHPRLGIQWAAPSSLPAPTLWLPLNVGIADSSVNGFTADGTPTPTLTTADPPPIFSAYHQFEYDETDALSYLDADDFDPGAGDFSIVAFVRPTSKAGLSSYPSWFAKGFYESDAGSLVGFADLVVNRYGVGGTTPWRETSAASSTLTVGAWSRVAIIRSGGTVFLYQDEVERGTFSATGLDFANTYPFQVGGHPLSASQRWQGGISDFVYIKGTALTTGQLSYLQTNPYTV